MKNVQQKLADAGFYHRDIDGVWGPATQAALRSYQRANSLAVTGELDTATKTMMYPDTH
jgi:peptidoglycan hydrolase-like protein with peptidoglycan-binding domain